jgi:hypothetical protein
MDKPEIGKLYNYIENENSLSLLQVSRKSIKDNNHRDYFLISIKLLQPMMVLDHYIVDRYKAKLPCVKFLAQDGQVCYSIFWDYCDFNSMFTIV